MTLARVILRPGRAAPFYGRHPWIYAGSIATIEGEPADGDEVAVHSHAGNFVAHGLFNGRSKIRVRLYAWSEAASLDRVFFREQLEAAVRLRGPVLGLDEPGQACRLVFSESDGLSGCIVDRYDRWLVMQITALGMARRRELLAELLVELCHPEGIYLRTERGIGRQEGLELQDGLLCGTAPSEPIAIKENGLVFLANLREGQKTGLYLDQRDNRVAVSHLAAGRRVLDAFCYTGGFGIYAARAGARAVVGVDVSEPALVLARANASLNGLPDIDLSRGDVFDYLTERVAAGDRFGLIVLDPPKFARARDAVEDAMRGYRRLQTLAIRLLEPDGILVTCCCSGLITRAMLLDLLGLLAAEERRAIQVLECRGQAADHPVSASCPESDYLKCIIARVR